MGAKESKQDTPGLEDIFKQIDTTGDGFITAQCLELLNWGLWKLLCYKKKNDEKSMYHEKYVFLISFV